MERLLLQMPRRKIPERRERDPDIISVVASVLKHTCRSRQAILNRGVGLVVESIMRSSQVCSLAIAETSEFVEKGVQS